MRGLVIWLKKTALISDFEDTFCGLVDFERSTDHYLASIFQRGFGFCLF